MAEEIKPEDILGAVALGVGAAVLAIFGAILSAIVSAAVAIGAAVVNLVTSWWIVPICIVLILIGVPLFGAYEQNQQRRERQQRAEEARQRREETTQRHLAEARRKSEYNKAYSTFRFVTNRSPKEARAQLKRLQQQYPDLLSMDTRRPGDYQVLLKSESRQAKRQIRKQLRL